MSDQHSDTPISKQQQTYPPLNNKFVSKDTETKTTETDEKSNGYHDQKLSFNLNTTTKYIKQTETIYLTQCPSLKLENSKQLALWKLLSIQRQNNNYPLMLYIIDLYLRDKLQYFIDKGKTLTIQAWCNEYKRVQQLLNKHHKTSKNSQLENIIISGTQTYLNRYCIPIMLPTLHRIDDSIERFTQCIQEASSLILAIMKNPLEILPFQIDLLIIPQNVIDIHNNEHEDSYGGSSGSASGEFDDIPDSDESSEEPSDILEQKSTESEIESVNIKSRLESNNIKYAYNNEPNPTMTREFMKLYKEYIQLSDKIGATNYLKLNGKSPSDLDNLGSDLQRMPHRKRLCIVVDRRLNQSKTFKKCIGDRNEIYLYEPHIFNKIPSEHMKEWYMESTNQCVLPGDNNNKSDYIKANTSMDGWINIFSFHIENEEDIKCYFYRNGQMVRFMPDDIVKLFPYLFQSKNFKNEKFIDVERKSKTYMNKLKKIWKDSNFQIFQDQLS